MEITPATPFESLPQFLTPVEVITLTRIGRSSFYDAVKRGDIPVVRFGRLIRVPREFLLKRLQAEN